MKKISDFLESNEDVELWLSLNALEQVKYDEESIFANSKNPRSYSRAISIAKIQLEYDLQEGKLRHIEKYYIELRNRKIDQILNN